VYRLNRDVIVNIPPASVTDAWGESNSNRHADDVRLEVSTQRDWWVEPACSTTFPLGTRVEEVIEVSDCPMVLCNIGGHIVATERSALSIEH
jgi:hypothetical protein